jgi:phage terminase large subunit
MREGLVDPALARVRVDRRPDGLAPAGIVFSEWALSNPASWAYLAPIVVESDGWAVFITTARGRNHAKSTLDMAAMTRKDWFSEVLPVNVTGAMTEDAVEQQRIEYTGIFGKLRTP